MSTLPIIFKKPLAKSIENYSNESKVYIDYISDSSRGIYEIKSFYAQSFFNKKHEYLNKGAEKARASNKFTEFMMERTTIMLNNASFIVMIGAGGVLILRGQITVGVLLAAIQLLGSMVHPIGIFFTQWGNISSSKGLSESYYKEPPRNNGAPPPTFANSINLEQVTFSYPHANGLELQNEVVLDNLSISFERGRTYAIVGESGCGKSTLAKIVAGLLVPTSGSVLFDGHNLNGLDKDSYCARVRYIDQSAHLFDFDVRENIEMGNPTGKTIEYLQQLGLGDIDPSTGIEFLSGGQKQRIVMARALNRLPDVLILDEPTANLDTDTALSAIKYLQSYNELTLIVITHSDNDEMLSLFDEIVRMVL